MSPLYQIESKLNHEVSRANAAYLAAATDFDKGLALGRSEGLRKAIRVARETLAYEATFTAMGYAFKVSIAAASRDEAKRLVLEHARVRHFAIDGEMLIAEPSRV